MEIILVPHINNELFHKLFIELEIAQRFFTTIILFFGIVWAVIRFFRQHSSRYNAIVDCTTTENILNNNDSILIIVFKIKNIGRVPINLYKPDDFVVKIFDTSQNNTGRYIPLKNNTEIATFNMLEQYFELPDNRYILDIKGEYKETCALQIKRGILYEIKYTLAVPGYSQTQYKYHYSKL